MSKKINPLIIVLAIVVLVFAAKSGMLKFSGSLIGGDNYCYQESNWIPNQVGTDTNCLGLYNLTMVYGYEPTASAGVFSFTYGKPTHTNNYAKDAVYLLKMGLGASPVEYDIPSACFNAYPDKIEIQVYDQQYSVFAQCWNGASWQIFTAEDYSGTLLPTAFDCRFDAFAWHTVPPFQIEPATECLDGDWNTYLGHTGSNSYGRMIPGTCTNRPNVFYEEAIYWHIKPYPTMPTQPPGSSINVINQNITIGWAAATPDISNYLIYRSVAGSGFSLYQTVDGNTFSYLDGDLLPSTQYQYRISAVNIVGEGLYTEPGAVTTWRECNIGDWHSADESCQPNNFLTRNWTRMQFCNGGVMHPAQEEVACVYTAPPTCSDLIQNQGETGIDCGGPCSACPPQGGGGGGGGGGGSTQTVANETAKPETPSQGMSTTQKLIAALAGFGVVYFLIIRKK